MHFTRILPLLLVPALTALHPPARGEQAPRRTAPAVLVVRHKPRLGSGWAVAETTNFRIYHNESQETAEKTARIAEATREAMTRKWFGANAPPWASKCDIYLYATAVDYSRETHAPMHAPGHASVTRDSERIIGLRVDLHCDEPNMLTAVLPHETTHVILAGRLGQHAVPRWADEGIAVLSEPRERIEWHLRNLPLHERDGTLFSVGKLMQMVDYPPPQLLGPFYAQSVSLVEYLSKKKGSATFGRFLREGLDKGYETALEHHYGYRSFVELERDWRKYAFGDASVAEQK